MALYYSVLSLRGSSYWRLACSCACGLRRGYGNAFHEDLNIKCPQLHRGLHHAVKRVNEILYKYDLLIGVDDQGRFSCKKVYVS